MFGRGISEVYSSLNSNTTAPSTCSSDVGVFCPDPAPSVCQTGNVRLNGSKVKYEGRLEVCVGEQWGTICDDSWDVATGFVTCQQLGRSGKSLMMNAPFCIAWGNIMIRRI